MRFELHRDTDVSGVSGIGQVAEGVVFNDGSVALRWLGVFHSTAIHESIAAVVSIHGHNGLTRVIWLDYRGDEDVPAPTWRDSR